jgi:hypothetical protein
MVNTGLNIRLTSDNRKKKISDKDLTINDSTSKPKKKNERIDKN